VALGDGSTLKALEINPRPLDAVPDEIALRVHPDDVVILDD
jgi:hypothetical protein